LEKTMTWNSFHHRGDVLRDVIAAADARTDGFVPMDVPGVAETFGDELTLIGALQLRWHTRLAGRIERELMEQPRDMEALDAAVIAAWRATADELPGIRAIVDRYRAEPLDDEMAQALTKATSKERLLLAVMAGRVSTNVNGPDAVAVRVGEQIEARARASYRRPVGAAEGRPAHLGSRPGLMGRLLAALAA
jgi:hypothetical protein